MGSAFGGVTGLGWVATSLGKSTFASNAPLPLSVIGHAAPFKALHIYQHEAPNSPARETLAVRYGLITDETKAVLVKQRAETDRIEGLPIVTPVSHMVAAGMVAADMVMALVMALVPLCSTYAADGRSFTKTLSGKCS